MERVLDQVVPPYFIFGERGDAVDLATSEGDIMTGIPRTAAERLIRDMDALRAMVLALAELVENDVAYRIIYTEGLA